MRRLLLQVELLRLFHKDEGLKIYKNGLFKPFFVLFTLKHLTKNSGYAIIRRYTIRVYPDSSESCIGGSDCCIQSLPPVPRQAWGCVEG